MRRRGAVQAPLLRVERVLVGGLGERVAHGPPLTRSAVPLWCPSTFTSGDGPTWRARRPRPGRRREAGRCGGGDPSLRHRSGTRRRPRAHGGAGPGPGGPIGSSRSAPARTGPLRSSPSLGPATPARPGPPRPRGGGGIGRLPLHWGCGCASWSGPVGVRARRHRRRHRASRGVQRHRRCPWPLRSASRPPCWSRPPGPRGERRLEPDATPAPALGPRWASGERRLRR